jgi:hypothetical protein
MRSVMTPDVPVGFEVCGNCEARADDHAADGDRRGFGQLACDGFVSSGRCAGDYRFYLLYRAKNDREPSVLVASELARLGAVIPAHEQVLEGETVVCESPRDVVSKPTSPKPEAIALVEVASPPTAHLAAWKAQAHRRGLAAMARGHHGPAATSAFLLGFYVGCGASAS